MGKIQQINHFFHEFELLVKAEGSWEAPSGRRKSWRKKKESGKGYSYRKNPPGQGGTRKRKEKPKTEDKAQPDAPSNSVQAGDQLSKKYEDAIRAKDWEAAAIARKEFKEHVKGNTDSKLSNGRTMKHQLRISDAKRRRYKKKNKKNEKKNTDKGKKESTKKVESGPERKVNQATEDQAGSGKFSGDSGIGEIMEHMDKQGKWMDDHDRDPNVEMIRKVLQGKLGSLDDDMAAAAKKVGMDIGNITEENAPTKVKQVMADIANKMDKHVDHLQRHGRIGHPGKASEEMDERELDQHLDHLLLHHTGKDSKELHGGAEGPQKRAFDKLDDVWDELSSSEQKEKGYAKFLNELDGAFKKVKEGKSSSKKNEPGGFHGGSDIQKMSDHMKKQGDWMEKNGKDPNVKRLVEQMEVRGNEMDEKKDAIFEKHGLDPWTTELDDAPEEAKQLFADFVNENHRQIDHIQRHGRIAHPGSAHSGMPESEVQGHLEQLMLHHTGSNDLSGAHGDDPYHQAFTKIQNEMEGMSDGDAEELGLHGMLNKIDTAWHDVKHGTQKSFDRRIVEQELVMKGFGIYIESNGQLRKAGGPYIGKRGGKYADPEHKIPWKDPSKGGNAHSTMPSGSHHEEIKDRSQREGESPAQVGADMAKRDWKEQSEKTKDWTSGMFQSAIDSHTNAAKQAKSESHSAAFSRQPSAHLWAKQSYHEDMIDNLKGAKKKAVKQESADARQAKKDTKLPKRKRSLLQRWYGTGK